MPIPDCSISNISGDAGPAIAGVEMAFKNKQMVLSNKFCVNIFMINPIDAWGFFRECMLAEVLMLAPLEYFVLFCVIFNSFLLLDMIV